MKGRITNIEEGGLGDILLTVDIDLTDPEFEARIKSMNVEGRVKFHETDEYQNYLDKLEKAPKSIHLGNVEITYLDEKEEDER